MRVCTPYIVCQVCAFCVSKCDGQRHTSNVVAFQRSPTPFTTTTPQFWLPWVNGCEQSSQVKSSYSAGHHERSSRRPCVGRKCLARQKVTYILVCSSHIVFASDTNASRGPRLHTSAHIPGGAARWHSRRRYEGTLVE